MRLAFWLLLLANLLLLLWAQGHFGGQDAGREPARLARQIQAERLEIVPPGQALVPVPLSCKRIEWLSAAEAQSVRETIALQPGWAAGEPQPRSEGPVYWVLIPDLASRSLADKKKAELQKLQVSEGEVVESAEAGPYAVSLGQFRGQVLAEDFLRALAKKGVRSARLRQRILPPERFALEVRAPITGLDRKLAELLPPQAQFRLLDCAAH